MKAIVLTRYGSADDLELREVERPVPRADQVLVKVSASSLNSWDWDIVRGALLVRPWGLWKPSVSILGGDIAGRVEAVGPQVQGLKVGDDVFGDSSDAGWGGFAEYACVREERLARKSAALSFEQAATIPHAGVLALQGLRRLQPLQAGQHILINGAGGGVGTFAIQLAKASGAEVTAVDSAAKHATLRAAGADHVIDYAAQDFTRLEPRYDRILDVVGQRSITNVQRVLTADGIYIMVGGTVSTLVQLMLLRGYIARTSRRKVDILVHRPDTADFTVLEQLCETGQIQPVIDHCCKLEELPRAMQRFGQGQIHGKVVVRISDAT